MRQRTVARCALVAAAAVALGAAGGSPAAGAPATHAEGFAATAASRLLGASPSSPLATAAQGGRRGAVYGGHAIAGSQYPVALALSGTRTAIQRVVSAFHAKCTTGLAFNLVDDSAVSIAIGRDGRFSGTHEPGPFTLGGGITATAQVTVSGRVAGRRIAGAISLHVDEKDAGGATVATCDAAYPIRARSVPGRVYAGATSQNGPVVVELSRSRTKVRHLRVGWQSSCQSGAEFQVADDQVHFRIRRRRFGDEYDARPYDVPGGGQGVDHYDVRGTVARRKVSGAFRVTSSEVDAAGAPTDSCDSGPLTFRARSG